MPFSRALQLVILSGALGCGCSRSFVTPTDAPPRIAITTPVGAGDGGAVLLQDNGVPVVSGNIHLHASKQQGSGPVARVDFWTPGLPHDDGDANFDWDLDTHVLWPSGGVMTLYVTPYDLHDQAGTPVERSYLVDNAPPEVTIQSPVSGSTLPPGNFNLAFCAHDRPNVTRLKLAVQRVGATSGPQTYGVSDAGAGCYLSDPIAVDLDARQQVTLDVVATDDVNNISHTQVSYNGTRELGRFPLAGSLFAGPSSAPPFGAAAAFTAGYGVALSGTYGPVETWLTGQAATSRYVPLGDSIPLPIPGSAGLFVELVPSNDGGPAIAEVQALDDGGTQSRVVAPMPASLTSYINFRTASGPRSVCVVPQQYAPADPLLCLDADGGVLSADLPSGGVFARYLAVFPGSVVVEYDDGTTMRLAHYQFDGGLARDADLPLPGSAILSSDCTTSIAGVVCDNTGGAGGLHLDAATGAMEVLGPPAGNAYRLAAAPSGGALYAVTQIAKGQVDLEERWADGGSTFVGCLGPDTPAGNLTPGMIEYDLHQHLYVFYRDNAQAGHIRAFGPGGTLEWEWSTSNAQQVGSPLALDPFVDPNASSATLMLAMPGEAVILARGDPHGALPEQCRR